MGKRPICSCLVINILLFSWLILASNFVCFAGGEAPPQDSGDKVCILEDFSAGALDNNWWRFGDLTESFAVPEDPRVGAHFLKLIGTAKDWYVGGRGFYVGKDASQYDALELWILGKGPSSGKLKIELFDDDNNTREIEQDTRFQPTKDDKFEYELKINWVGWKKVTIPFKSFSDANPGVGNDLWDPRMSGDSAGLTQIQFIFIAGSETGSVSSGLGRICLVKSATTK